MIEELGKIEGIDEIIQEEDKVIVKYAGREKEISTTNTTEIPGKKALSKEELEEKIEELAKKQTEENYVIGIDSWGNEVDMNLWRYFYYDSWGWNLYDGDILAIDQTQGIENTANAITKSGYVADGIENGTIKGEIPAYIIKKENGTINRGQVLGMNGTFANLASLTTLPNDIYIPNSVDSMAYMFLKSGMQTIPDSFTIPNQVNNIEGMFAGCVNLTTIPNSFKISNNVKNMHGTFSYCTNLATISNSFTIPNGCTNTGMLFAYCENLTKLPNKFEIPQSVEYLEYMFLDCKKLTQIPDSLKIPTKCNSIKGIFSLCSQLKTLPNKFVIPSNIIIMSEAFKNCDKLGAKIYIQGNPREYEDMFGNLEAATGEGISIYVSDEFEGINDFLVAANNSSYVKIKGQTKAKTAGDNMELYCRLTKTSRDNHKWVILVHGLTRSKDSAEIENLGVALMQNGYNVLAPDLRGHGESNAKPTTLGWLEGKDMVDWANYITNIDPQAKIALYGMSLGAATVMVASGEALPSTVKGIVEDSGFTSISAMVTYAESQDNYPLPIHDIIATMQQAYPDIDFMSTSVLEQVKKCTLPMLFFHGDADTIIPKSMCDELYAAAKMTDKQQYISTGYEHTDAIFKDSQYATKLQEGLSYVLQ